MRGELSLDHARTFLTAYRAGSLSAAARNLGLSQSTVTAHIAAFEQALGFTLFERTRTGVTPTARAKSLASALATHVDDLERALWAAQPSRSLHARTLHLASPAEYLSVRLLPRISLWRPAAVSVRVHFGLADQLLTELREGTHDLVISSVPVRLRGLEATPLYDEEFALVGTPDWRDRWRAGGSGPQVGAVPVVAYAADLPIIRRWWRTVWGQRPSSLTIVATVPDLRTVTAMVLQGVGVSVLPTYLIERYLDDGSLTALAEPLVPPLNTLSVVTTAGACARDAALAELHERLLTLEHRPTGSPRPTAP